VSTGAEVQAVFDDVLGLDGAIDWLRDDPAAPDYIGTTHGVWYSWRPNGDYVEAYVWTENSTNVLRGLRFAWQYSAKNVLNTQTSPQNMIREFGAPTRMFASVYGTELGNEGVLKLMMVYEQGFAYNADIRVPIYSEGAKKAAAQFCLDGQVWSGEQDAGGRVLSIFEPLTDGLNNLSPIQNELFGVLILRLRLVPIQELFEMTTEQIAQKAVQEDDACFYSIDLWPG
jgi:hypothetical protein